MKFLYVTTKNLITDKIPMMLELITEAVDIVKYESTSNSLTVYFKYSKIEIIELANIMVFELYEDIKIYESLKYQNKEALNEALLTVENIFDKMYFKDSFVNNKTILELHKSSVSEDLKRLILSHYYNNKDIKNTIKVFLEHNQNITSASEALYLHRNTLNQRLTKFEEVTSFNVKKFIDGYLIYHILK